MRLSFLHLTLYALLISVLAIALYLPGLGGGFTLDDGYNILQNRLLYVDVFNIDDFIIAAFSFHGVDGSRALPLLSFALDYWRSGGMDASAFKMTNLLIHGITVFFLVFMLRRLLEVAGWSHERSIWIALLLAFLWGIHPLQVSSVLYIVQRMQTMATLFIILALWAYLGMRQSQILGQRGRLCGVQVVIFGLLALLCKEDAVLLLAYTLILELTVLRFRAAQPSVQRGLKQSYLVLTVFGLLGYLFVVVPHFWYWEASPGRDFTTPERLMTQGRVLVMYLYQIVIPWPDNMPFIYDAFQPSRGIWSPWTTLPSILLVVALLAWGWMWRHRRPVFACGVLLFFAGHFITSNVIALELVFEHRNHFPLIGVLLALMDLSLIGVCRWKPQAGAWRIFQGTIAILILWVGAMTALHANTWGDPVRHGKKLVELSPESPRAWIQYGNVFSSRYNDNQNKADLVMALEVTEEALQHISSTTLASNAITYKAMLGEDASADWERYFEALKEAPKDWQNQRSVEVLMNNVRREFDVDKINTLRAMEILDQRASLSGKEALEYGLFVYRYVDKEKAFPWLKRFVQRTHRNDASLVWLFEQLEVENRPEWSEQLKIILDEK
ncbi:hypothetical protein MWU49_15150 [Alcanivorax sp. S6407]|uniref:hypothetical protein n=1 Tax=Alcanivorax sp. S6407 TaxID=2926424 RepID=UPI001FF57C52|nr:hypothetical protein [Alcanivorax sp. S6407]MCK0155050.1 hypothetical protein [Alcanivorax sp. S6407]